MVTSAAPGQSRASVQAHDGLPLLRDSSSLCAQVSSRSAAVLTGGKKATNWKLALKENTLYEQPVPLQPTTPYPLPPTHLTLCCPGSCHEINAIFITAIFERLPAQLVSWQQHRTVIVACFYLISQFPGRIQSKKKHRLWSTIVTMSGC